MQTLFPEMWNDEVERLDELRLVSVEVLADWAEYAPLLKYLRQAEVHTLGDVALLQPSEVRAWRGVGAKRVQTFVRLIEHICSHAADFLDGKVCYDGQPEVIEALSAAHICCLAGREEVAPLLAPLQHAGIHTLGDIIALTNVRMGRLPRFGAARRTKLQALRTDILAHYEDYLALWQRHEQQHTYPRAYWPADDEPVTAAQVAGELEAVLTDFAAVSPGEGKWAKAILVEGKSPERVAAQCHKSPKTVLRLIEEACIAPLLSGASLLGLRLRPSLLVAMQDLRERLRYRSVDAATEGGGDTLRPVLAAFLSLSTYTAPGGWTIVIGRGEESVVRSTTEVCLKAMAALPRAGSEAVLMRLWTARAAARGKAFDSRAALALLHTPHPWVEEREMGGVKCYRLAARHIERLPVRLARIIDDARRPLTSADIVARYTDIYSEQPKELMSTLAQLSRYGYGVSIAGIGAERTYATSIRSVSRPTLQDALPALIERLGYTFYLSDMQRELQHIGIDADSEDSLHAAITQWCSSAMDHIHHYCHKAHLAEHPETQWRQVRVKSLAISIRDIALSLLRRAPEHRLPMEALLDGVQDHLQLRGLTYNKDIKAKLFAFTAPTREQALAQHLPFHFEMAGLTIHIVLTRR